MTREAKRAKLANVPYRVFTRVLRVPGETPYVSECVAKTAGKARYELWNSCRDYNRDVKFSDISVSVNRTKRPDPKSGWEHRLSTANQIIKIIASHGRHFLSENSDVPEEFRSPNPFIAYFEMDANNELWYYDRYTRRPILVRLDRWRGFSEGGTLESVVSRLRDYILLDSKPRFWPASYWGYGDMTQMCQEIETLLAVDWVK